MWEITAILAIQGAIALYTYLTRPPKTLPESRLLDLAASLPRTDEGTPVPLVFGRVRVERPLLVYYSAPVNVLYENPFNPPESDIWLYGMDMLFVVGIPMREPAHGVDGLGNVSFSNEPMLHAMYIGDDAPQIAGMPLQGFAAGDGVNGGNRARSIVVHSLGGPGQGGSAIGTICWWNGSEDQLVSNLTPGSDVTPIAESMRLNLNTDTDIPSYKGQMLVSLTADGYAAGGVPNQFGGIEEAWQLGESASLPSYSFEVSSYGPNLISVPYIAGFGVDADPMEVIYDIITSDWGKAAYPSANVDIASLQAASAVLGDEGIGYSRVHYDTEDAKRVVQSILEICSGVMYEEPRDGKLYVKLIRNDFDPDDPEECPHFALNGLGLLRVDDYTNGSQRETFNEVLVRYTSRAVGYLTRVARETSLGNASGQNNRKRSVTLDYPGVCTEEAAQKIAARELSVVSQALSKGTFVLDRSAQNLRPGSPFRITYEPYGIQGRVFRVASIDRGDLWKGEIKVDATQDTFDVGFAEMDLPPLEVLDATPPPLDERKLTEAPRFLQLQAFNANMINDPEVQRILVCAEDPVPTDWPSPLDGFGVVTRETYSVFNQGTFLSTTFYGDVRQMRMPASAKVHTAYPKTTASYDVTTGLEIDSRDFHGQIIGFFQGVTPDPFTAISELGWNLILVDDELMAYESITDLGGGVLRLDNVWRELADTVPADHAVGARVWWVGAANVGLRGWQLGRALEARFQARSKYNKIGSGGDGSGDPSDTLTVRARARLPVRPTQFRIGVKDVTDIAGVSPPGETGLYASLSRLDGAIDLFANRRERTATTLVRGDTLGGSSAESGVAFFVFARKVGIPSTVLSNIISPQLADAAIAGGHCLGLGHASAGHGTIDVSILAARQVGASEGGVGLPVGQFINAWDRPTVRVVAPRWRNLALNGRFDYNSVAKAWSTSAGVPAVANTSSSIRRDSSGFYFLAGSAAQAALDQVVEVAGYKPRGMTAKLIAYGRNLGSDANDTGVILIDPSDSSGVSLGVSGSTSTAFPTANYMRAIANPSAVCPAGTEKIRIRGTLNEVATGGTTTPESVLTEFELILGQFTYDVLTNGSFEGGLGSWTNVTNSFVNLFAAPGPSLNYAVGGAFASSAIRQDYTIPAGWEFGTAVLRCWRMQTIAGDTGTVTLQVLNGGGAVIASSTTGAENIAVLNRWTPRVLSVELPTDGTAVTLRVLLEAVRTGGAGNSGAHFDEHVLSIHKDLEPRTTIDALFTSPTVQEMPTTRQACHLAFPTLPKADVFSGDAALDMPFGNFRWSDGSVARPSYKLVGSFGAGVASVNAYTFTRQIGANALELRSVESKYGRHKSTDGGWTYVALFRVRESGFSTACGLLGRMTSSRGWGMSIASTGALTAKMRGVDGNKSIARSGSTVHDGALHLAAITYDPVAAELHIDDERGRDTVSTASGLGEFDATGADALFRIGRDESANDTIPGEIARVFYFRGALTSSQIQSIWNYAQDPSGKLASNYALPGPCWVPGEPDAAGATLWLAAADQVPIGYASALTTLVDDYTGRGFGLCVTRACTNLAPSFTFTDATKWIPDGSTTLTQGIVDPTGEAAGVTVSCPNTSNGLRQAAIPLTATTTVRVIFYARAPSGTPTIKLELLNASLTVKNTQTKALDGGTAWKRYAVDFTGWDASTPTGQIRFVSNSGAQAFDLGHVLFVHQDTANRGQPVLWHRDPAGQITTNTTATIVATGLTVQYNTEGEIMAEGVMLDASPPGTHAIAMSRNAANDKNRRELWSDGSFRPRHEHWDGAAVPASATSTGTAIDWSLPWSVRGRWRRAQLIDSTANRFAGVVTDASVDSENYGRAATWTTSSDLTDTIIVGTGNAASGNCADMILRRLRLTACEEKLA